MADPLSITVGVLALIKVSAQVSLLVKEFCDEVSIVDATLAGVLNEVEGFQQVLEAMKETFEQDDIKANLQATGHVGTHWKNLARALEDGTTTLQQLYTLLEAINKTTSVLDKPRRQLRLKNAAEQISVYREQIKSYRAALQLSLSTVILWNQVTFQKSTEEIPDKILPTLDKLYDEFRKFGASLNAKIEKLESTVTSQSDESDHELKRMSNLRECVHSAAEVVSTTSSTLTAEISDKVSIRNGSDFGDIFVKGNNEAMLRWISSNTVYEFDDAESPFPDPSEASTGAATEYQSDSDSDIENEMIRALFNDGKKRKEKGDFPAAARLFRNCLARFSSNAGSASLTSSQSVSTCGFSKIELLELLTNTYSAMESWSEAKLTILEKLSITERQVGKKDQLYLWDTLHLAGYLMKTKEFVEAHLQGRRSLRGFKRLGEPGYEGYESCLNFLCDLCKLEGKVDEEEAYLALLGNHRRKIKGSSSHAAPLSTVNSDAERLPEKNSVPGPPAPEISRNDNAHTALKKEVLRLQDSTENTNRGAQDSFATSQNADYSNTTNSDKDNSVGPISNPPVGESPEDNEARRNTSPAQNTLSFPGQKVVLKEKTASSFQSKNTPKSRERAIASEQRTPQSEFLVEGLNTPRHSSPPAATLIPLKLESKRRMYQQLIPWIMNYSLKRPSSATSCDPNLYRLAAESSWKNWSNLRRTDLAFLTNFCKYLHLPPPQIFLIPNEGGWGAMVKIPNKSDCLVDNCTTQEVARDAVVAKACFTHVTDADQEHVISLFDKRDPFSDKEVYESENNILGQIHKSGFFQTCPVCAEILPTFSEEEFSSHVNGCIDKASFPVEDAESELTTTAKATNSLDSAQDDLPDFSASEVREISSHPDRPNDSVPIVGTWACYSCERNTIQFLTRHKCENCTRSRTLLCPSSLTNFQAFSGISYQSSSPSLKAITESRSGTLTAERRVLLLGDTLCGKTFLASAWVDRKCPHNNTAMLNQFARLEIVRGYRMTLRIWDPNGEETSSSFMLRKHYFSDMHVILLCFDIANPDSLDNIEHRWIIEVQRYLPDIPIILVGCQRARRNVETVRRCLKIGGEMPLSPYAGVKMAKKIKAVAYCETSAEEGEAVDELFDYIVQAPVTSPSLSSKGISSGLRKLWSRS